MVSSLPAGCDAGVPAATAAIAFVAQGRAWAVSPEGKGLTCLFDVADAGPFAWGPRADRVLLGGLEVRGVGSSASRPSGSIEPALVSWGRPKGLAVAFVDPKGRKLEKALVGSTTIQNVTPFANATYQEVLYHPSGLALVFVLTDSDGSSIWMSSNSGTDPKRLVWSRDGTVFGPLAFRMDGFNLYYAARLTNGTRMISVADLGQSRVINGQWVGKEDILRLLPGPGGETMALDAGTGCDDRKAIVSELDGTAGQPLIPTATAPTSAIGWLDEATLLVSEGGCAGPMKLWRVELGNGGTTRLVFDGATRASVRISEPSPPPPLPKIGVNAGLA